MTPHENLQFFVVVHLTTRFFRVLAKEVHDFRDKKVRADMSHSFGRIVFFDFNWPTIYENVETSIQQILDFRKSNSPKLSVM